jgi:luciferase family oxidoreductase group 1
VLYNGRPPDTEEGFVNQLAELSAIFRGKVPESHPLFGQIANPAAPTAPEMWVLGSSTGGASFAAHLGMRFAFANFINAHAGAEVARAYRQSFRPWHEEQPRVALAMLALCTRDEAEAKAVEKAMLMRWAATAMGQNRPVPTIAEAAVRELSSVEERLAARDRPRATIGTADFVERRIRETAAEFGADEVILVAMAPAYELRSRTLEELAPRFGLEPRA